MMETMETEHVNKGIEWKKDGNMMETGWKQMETMETERINERIE